MRPSESITPHDTAGGWMPRPRKLSDASIRMLEATLRVDTTINVGRIFGRICRSIIILPEVPMVRAALMYSLFFRPSTSLRTIRA